MQPGAQRRISRWPGKQATGEGTQIQAGAPYNQDSFAALQGILNRGQGKGAEAGAVEVFVRTDHIKHVMGDRRPLCPGRFGRPDVEVTVDLT